MSRFVRDAVNSILQRFVLSIVEHGQSLISGIVQLDFLSPLRRTPFLPLSALYCGFPYQIAPRFTRFTHPLGHMFLMFPQDLFGLGPNKKVSRAQICIVLHIFSSECDTFSRLPPEWCLRCIQFL